MQTALSILLFAGVFGVAVTLWLFFRANSSDTVSEEATPGKAADPAPASTKAEQPRPKLLAGPGATSTSTALAPLVSVPPPPSENDAPNVGLLLHSAHEQLKSRQQKIESELVRIEGLRREHEAVSTQVKALDAVMGVFSLSQAADRPQDPQRFVPRVNGASVGASPEMVHASDAGRKSN